ncbi:MAG: hypothetical protein M3516_05940 [Actinomycetota bacterium]|nr:hypothetical protein [Actinomycetota bacterium]
MSATVIWRPEAFNARLIAAARPAAAEVAVAARAKAAGASKRVAASIFMSGTATNFILGSRSPLGVLFEQGVGAHEINPKKQVLKMADGGFVTGPVKHPGMAAKPFLKPALALWAPAYRRTAAGAIRGF